MLQRHLSSRSFTTATMMVVRIIFCCCSLATAFISQPSQIFRRDASIGSYVNVPPVSTRTPLIIKQSKLYATRQETGASSKSSVKKNNKDIFNNENKLSQRLVDALDLYPLLDNVAKYTGTKRGRDALLHLVTHESDDNIKRKGFLASETYKTSRRKTMLSSMAAASSSFTSNNVGGSGSGSSRWNRSNMKQIIKIAESASEAQEEWALVKEAMSVLEGHNDMMQTRRNNADGRRRNTRDSKTASVPLPLPPIYAADAKTPWDVGGANDVVDTDDDEWLHHILAGGFNGKLDLEHVLQADQIVKRILGTFEWSNCEAISRVAPKLVETFPTSSNIYSSNIDINMLRELQEEIEGTVTIARGNKSFDYKNTFVFQLNPMKFPNLSILKQKESNIIKNMNAVVEKLLANKKYLSQLSGFSRKKPEPYELDGRVVVAASKEVASRIGVIRGHSTTRSFCYVEPTEVVKMGNELKSIREEISKVENEVMEHLSATIVRSAININRGLDAVARLDTIFARAAFGYTLNGFIPQVGSAGVIDVENFIHPVLATKGGGSKVTPIDLQLSDDSHRALIISGPNGGGKSLAMKSFALVALMNKISIPIPRNDYSFEKGSHDDSNTRVDYFDDILVEIGDSQNLMDGESTYMAQLNSLSGLLEQIKPGSHEQQDEKSTLDKHFLILLDELGGGTDPTAGACIAQAILENILENGSTRTVVTTHSTQLKALSIDDDRFCSASVLLQAGDMNGSGYRLPTYKLCYGTVGNSYALGAASRSNPSLPNAVLDRAASLIASSQDDSGVYLRAITEALEKEKEALFIATQATDEYRDDIVKCRDSIISLSRSYDQHLSRIETRLDSMFKLLKADKDAYEIVGDTLSTLRLSKKVMQSREEMLRAKGMRVVSMNDKLMAGESVTIISKEYEGETGTISTDQNGAEFDEFMINIDFESGLSLQDSKLTLRVKRSNLAIWDYPGIDDGDWGSSNSISDVRSIPESRNNLLNLLGTIKTDDNNQKPTAPKAKGSGKFVSSRQRKAAGKKAKKAKKNKK